MSCSGSPKTAAAYASVGIAWGAPSGGLGGPIVDGFGPMAAQSVRPWAWHGVSADQKQNIYIYKLVYIFL